MGGSGWCILMCPTALVPLSWTPEGPCASRSACPPVPQSLPACLCFTLCLPACLQGPVFDSDSRRPQGPVLTWIDKLLKQLPSSKPQVPHAARDAPSCTARV